jgi:hypothetical protein
VTEAAYAVLEDSGVLDLEQRVLAYIYAHGGAVKLMATVDDIGRLLGEVRKSTKGLHDYYCEGPE